MKSTVLTIALAISTTLLAAPNRPASGGANPDNKTAVKQAPSKTPSKSAAPKTNSEVKKQPANRSVKGQQVKPDAKSPGYNLSGRS